MRVALGVGGGIAAYKAAELARALMERGFTVQVVMTRAAEEFIRPLTFAALTGQKVLTNLFCAASAEDTLASAVEHIRVAQENDILVVAPATADLLAKFAARPRGRFSNHYLSGVHGARGARAGDEHRTCGIIRRRAKMFECCGNVGTRLSNRTKACWRAAWSDRADWPIRKGSRTSWLVERRRRQRSGGISKVRRC